MRSEHLMQGDQKSAEEYERNVSDKGHETV